MRLSRFVIGGLMGAALVMYLSRNKKMPMLISKDSVGNLMNTAMDKMRDVRFNKMGELLNSDSIVTDQVEKILKENNQSLPN